MSVHEYWKRRAEADADRVTKELKLAKQREDKAHKHAKGLWGENVRLRAEVKVLRAELARLTKEGESRG